jgi:hypothetical protein
VSSGGVLYEKNKAVIQWAMFVMDNVRRASSTSGVPAQLNTEIKEAFSDWVSYQGGMNYRQSWIWAQRR